MDTVDLIKGVKNGDSDAYSLMVDLYHNKLCVYAYQLTNDRDLAKDIVQNVFITIWRVRSKLKDDFAIKSYLYKCVYNEFLNQQRSKKHTTTLDKKHIEALNDVLDEEEESFDKLLFLVKQEIEKLPPKCKQTFLLSKQEGLTNIEIAEYLNVSIKSVEAHITKAFSLLRDSVSQKLNGILFLLFGLKKN